MIDKLSAMPVVRWIWRIGGPILAGIGILCVTMFFVDSMTMPITGIAGTVFVVVGASTAVLGWRSR